VRAALLFPGQGAQTAQFLSLLPDRPAVRATLAEAANFLGEDVRRLDSAESLRSTVAVQLTVLTAGVAYSRLLGEEQSPPDAVAGLSVGAFAAAVACESLSFAAALRLVKLRAEAMQAAFGSAGFGMVAILGLGESAVRSLAEPIATPAAPLYVASINAPAEIVLAGSDASLSSAVAVAERSGGRARRLNVSVPSHGALLEPVSARLREAMRDIRLADPRVPYISNHRARVARDAAAVAEDLVLNVSRTVKWHESMLLLYELGARLFVEAPPGRALSNLVKSEFPQARAIAADDLNVESIAHLIHAAASEPSSPQ
jgi:malonate decarboxylase epsilon subunit